MSPTAREPTHPLRVAEHLAAQHTPVDAAIRPNHLRPKFGHHPREPRCPWRVELVHERAALQCTPPSSTIT